MTNLETQPVAKISYISGFIPNKYVLPETTEETCRKYTQNRRHEFIREGNSNWFRCIYCNTEECHAQSN